MNLAATVLREHLGELELMRALPQMQARLQSLGLPVSEDAMQTWEACRKTFTQADVLEAEIPTLRDERDDLRAKIAAAAAAARTLDAEIERLQAAVAEQNAEIARLRSIQAEMASTQQRIAELEKRQQEDVHKRAAALIVRYGIRRASSTETETPKNHHAPHQEN